VSEQPHPVFTFEGLKNNFSFENHIWFYVTYSTDFKTFPAASAWSNGNWQFLLCKGLLDQISPWLYWF